MTENHEYQALMGRMLRAYARRVSKGDLHDLAGLAAFAQDAEQALREAVWRQRAAGRSWTEIGRALGVTRQAAQKRFGDPEGTGVRKVGGQPSHLR